MCFILLFVGFCLALQFLLLAYVFVCIHPLYFLSHDQEIHCECTSYVHCMLDFSRSHCGIKERGIEAFKMLRIYRTSSGLGFGIYQVCAP
jgi:hypothetical protein